MERQVTNALFLVAPETPGSIIDIVISRLNDDGRATCRTLGEASGKAQPGAPASDDQQFRTLHCRRSSLAYRLGNFKGAFGSRFSLGFPHGNRIDE